MSGPLITLGKRLIEDLIGSRRPLSRGKNQVIKRLWKRMEKQEREKGDSCDEVVSSQDYGTTALRVPRGAANYRLCSSLASLQVSAQIGDFNWNSLAYLVS